MNDLNRLAVSTRINVGKAQIDENVKANLESLVGWSYQYRPCIIVGGGPSLQDPVVGMDLYEVFCNPCWSWRDMNAEHKTPIFALNDAFKDLKIEMYVPNDPHEHWLTPDYVVMMDARPEMADMACIREPIYDADYLLASQVHPGVFDRLDDCSKEDFVGQIVMWHAAGSDAVAELGLSAVAGSGTVLTRAVPIAYEMGFRQFHLFGVDSSYSEDGRHHAYDQPLNDNANTIEVFTPIKKRRFITTGALAEQAQFCMSQWQQLERFGCEFHVYGEGLLPAMWREKKEAREDLDTHEPEKYRRMWAVPEYRKNSIGENKFEAVKEALGASENGVVIDFGCGTGRVASLFKRNGYDVEAIDFADNCLDDDARLHLGKDFVAENLWNLAPRAWGPSGVYGVCTDVMEHIPPEKVDAVLGNISREVCRCVFTISFQPDQFGAVIGEKLHMTVKPAKWWGEKLKQHFKSVVYKGNGLFVCDNEEPNA